MNLPLPSRRVRAVLLSLALACHAPGHAEELHRVIVPAPAAGSLDATARLIAQRLSVLTGDNYVVENRPGGNTMIGNDLVSKAPADARTILFTGTGIAMLAALQKVASPLEELAPVIRMTSETYALAVPTAGAIATIDDLQRLAAARPGGLNCLSVPGAAFVACEQLRERLGSRSTTVPYPGIAPATTALVGGHGDVMFIQMVSALKLVETGRIRVLAVSQRTGLPAPIAALPLVSEVWPGFLLEGFSGFFAPVRTPAARLHELNRNLNFVLADPEVSAALRAAGQEPAGGTVQQFHEVLQRLTTRYGAVIQRLNLAYR